MSSGAQVVPSDFALRFRSAADWFTHSELDGVYTSVIGANSERAVDLMHLLVYQFPESLSVSISSLRQRKSWWENACSRTETRDVIARLKLLLAGYGGVEFAVYTTDDQLTLTPELELIVYSRSPKWREALLKMGLEERHQPPTAVWCASRSELSAAPELLDSLAIAVRRLGLAPGDFDVDSRE
ncbi:MAG: hypothetical protein ABJB74_05785 [Gemmatimonas sp.]